MSKYRIIRGESVDTYLVQRYDNRGYTEPCYVWTTVWTTQSLRIAESLVDMYRQADRKREDWKIYEVVRTYD